MWSEILPFLEEASVSTGHLWFSVKAEAALLDTQAHSDILLVFVLH